MKKKGYFVVFPFDTEEQARTFIALHAQRYCSTIVVAEIEEDNFFPLHETVSVEDFFLR